MPSFYNKQVLRKRTRSLKTFPSNTWMSWESSLNRSMIVETPEITQESRTRCETTTRPWKSLCLYSWVNAKYIGRKKTRLSSKKCSSNLQNSASNTKRGGSTWRMCCSWRTSTRKPSNCRNHSSRSSGMKYWTCKPSCSPTFAWRSSWSPRIRKPRKSWRRSSRRKRNSRTPRRTTTTSVWSI